MRLAVRRRRRGQATAAAVIAVALLLAPATPAGAIVIPLPNLLSTVTAQPAPIPVASGGRIPVSLRLADSIWTADGAHPPAATEARFEFDKSFQLDLSQAKPCPGGAHFDIRTGVSPCEEYEFASGRIKVEVAFPENMPMTVSGRAIAFGSGPREFAIHAYLPAPVTAEIAIPVTIGSTRSGAYGLRATAAVPKIAGGYGSLTYLGLRFDKGLFSAACPKGRLQTRVTNSFVDGTMVAGVRFLPC